MTSETDLQLLGSNIHGTEASSSPNTSTAHKKIQQR